jgi:two-component system KDP operon response regulator KdpE
MNVLAIDDDVAMTELTAMLLRTHGFTVRTANNARDTFKIVSENWAQALVLDLMMPDMDGRQICHKIREFSNVPIIILSALNDPDSVASALDSGADDYLVKPVPSDVLAAHIKRIIKRTGQLTLPNEAIVQAWNSPTIPVNR